jgi:hypothetical protein
MTRNTARNSAPFDVLARLEELSQLEPNWDSYGAAPITTNAIESAREFFGKVQAQMSDRAAEAVLPSDISPIPNGGILAEWVGPAAEIEIHVGPEGKLGYLYIDKRGPDRRFEEADEISLTDALQLVEKTLTAR